VTKVIGLAVFDVGDVDNLTISAVADHGTVSTSVAHVPLANGLNESLADINATLNSGIVYRPNNNPDNQKIVDHVLVTVTDSHGLSDSLNLVFKQSGEGGAILQGTEGKDIFFATGGNDTFVFNADFANNGSFGHDTIRGFDVYHDVIGINGIQEDLAYLYAHATSVNDGADVLITPDNPFDPSHTSTILLKGVTMEQLHGGLSA